MFACRSMSCAPRIIFVLALVVALASGCKKQPVAVAPLPVEQVPTTIEKAFQQAAPEVRQDATAALSALQNQNEPKAFFELHDLAARPELTPEQREAAMRAWAAVYAKLRAAAEKGDKKAEDAVNEYRATK